MKIPRQIILIAVVISSVAPLVARTPIFGSSKVDVDNMYLFVLRHNADFDRSVAEAFYEVGERYGIRGDIALCQAIIETGWFRYDNGTAVRPDSYNYCGLGVKKKGDRGCLFRSVEEGVMAMMQHLYAYACEQEIPVGERVVDPRFGFVARGSATTWEALAGRWAMNPRYGHNIMDIYRHMVKHSPDIVLPPVFYEKDGDMTECIPVADESFFK